MGLLFIHHLFQGTNCPEVPKLPAVPTYNIHCVWRGCLATSAVGIISSMSIVLPLFRPDSVPSGPSKLILHFYPTSMSIQELNVSSMGLPSFLFQVPYLNLPMLGLLSFPTLGVLVVNLPLLFPFPLHEILLVLFCLLTSVGSPPNLKPNLGEPTSSPVLDLAWNALY